MKSKRVGHGHMKWAVCGALLSVSTLAAATGPRSLTTDSLAHLDSLTLSEPIVTEGNAPSVLHPSLAGVTGRTEVLVRLNGESVAGSKDARSREQIAGEQAAFIDRILKVAPSAEVRASLQIVLNAVVLSVDAADLPQIARDTAIARVVGVSNYSQDLSETVPYIGGATAHAMGVTGKGVRIAVIDSGIDYTHAALGGPGTKAAYEAAWAPLPTSGPAIPAVPAGTGYLVVNDPGTTADDGLFPSSKVIGGYDFVGERWPNNVPVGAPPGTQPTLEPDPDPIGAPDATTFGGHGTHVSDIIAGKLGVAPDAKLYAFKACSSPATSCSGIALLQAMEYAVDPNQDGRTKDHVDIINMSLGSPYGQPFDDDLSLAVDNAAKVGVLTVAAAGNSADKQFIAGSPAAASSAISVAQTEVPSSTLQLMTVLSPPVGNRGAVFQPWSTPLSTNVEGPVFYPPAGFKRIGCGDASLPASDPKSVSPFDPGELAGKIVLVDRGTCSFSLKIANIAAAGGTIGIIGLITADAPFGGAFGGGVQTIPGYMISQADANLLRTGTGVVRFSTANLVSLAGSMASTSSRGPRFDDNIVKPEIGAPGASVSAMSGSFTGTGAFGGTSGATPMITGSAALLREARPFLSNAEIKQLLLSTAETQVFQPASASSVLPSQLAPITRIGGGEVRVDRALVAPVLLADVTGDKVSKVNGALSFGYLDASKPLTTLNRLVEVENTTNQAFSYTITPTLRYQDDKDTGAVTMTVSPTSIVVQPNGTNYVNVTLTVDGTKLRNNLMNSGSLGNAIGPLTANEYDGYIVFQGANHKLTMPWHILPRKSADVAAKLPTGHLIIDPVSGQGTVSLTNKGVGDAQISAYSMLGTGPDTPSGARGEGLPNPTMHAVGTNTFLQSGSCAFIWAFAFNMYERKASPVGTIHEVDIDVNNDGTYDYFVINQDVGGVTALSDGRQVTAVINARTGASIARFFVEHATNSANVILYACGGDMGLTQASIGQPMKANFFTYSWYFGGAESHLGPFLITPYGEEFTAAVPGDVLTYKQQGNLAVQQWGLFPGTAPNAGVLLINNSDFGASNRGGATKATEATLLPR